MSDFDSVFFQNGIDFPEALQAAVSFFAVAEEFPVFRQNV